MNAVMERVLVDVIKERERQVELWGIQNHEPSGWMVIAMEEFGEIAQAIQVTESGNVKDSDKGDIYTETIQTIAVLTAFAEDYRKKHNM